MLMLILMTRGGPDNRSSFALKFRQPERGDDRPLYLRRACKSLDRRALLHLSVDDWPRLLVALSLLARSGCRGRFHCQILASLVRIDFYRDPVLDVQSVA